jgi:hypothetical protein
VFLPGCAGFLTLALKAVSQSFRVVSSSFVFCVPASKLIEKSVKAHTPTAHSLAARV